MMAKQYDEELLEPQLRPEYLKEAKKIGSEKSIKVGTIKSLRERYEK